MNASALPLVSFATRFEACDTNATQCGERCLASPSAWGSYDGPLAGWPPRPVETSCAGPDGCHGSPRVCVKLPPRRGAETAGKPFTSPAARAEGAGPKG